MIRYRIPPEVIALILRIREERRYGAVRMSLYLQRHYQVYVSPTTILKIFHRHRVTRVSLKRYRPGPKPQADGPLPLRAIFARRICFCFASALGSSLPSSR
jgi:hypothetical protein